MQQAEQNQQPGDARRTRAIIGAIALIVGVLTTTIGMSTGTTLAYSSYEALPSTSASNEASYWGEGCTKLDRGNGTNSYKATADHSIVVLKAAQIDHVYYDVKAGDVLSSHDNDISHFIFCPPTTTTTSEATTTTTEATTTTTEATTTTTVAPTTTEAAEVGPTTTVAVTTTAPEVGQFGPTTTAVGSAGVTPTSIVTELPATGVDSTQTMALLGMGLMGLGLTLLVGSRRPQNI